jgi:hypothetical protein
MVHGFWGRSELIDLVEPQGFLAMLCDDMKRLIGLQIDKIIAFKGDNTITDEAYAQFRLSGFMNMGVGGGAEDLTPKFPPELLPAIKFMIEMINTYQYSFYTSVGYQFPAFPKPPTESKYKRGGDYYLSEYAPRLARELAGFLESGGERSLREIGSFMLDWNVKNDLRQYHFQYAAVVADIADWYPKYVDKASPFYYGTNAVECISYLAKPRSKMKQEEFLDKVMERIYMETGAYPYNAEDVCCDFIRWVENYVRPGADYNHLDFDSVWSSCRIKDHPFGRQEAMLKLGLIDTFNNMTAHPSDDTIIKANNMTVEQYKELCKTL